MGQAGLSGVVHVEVAWGKDWTDTIVPNGVDLDGTADFVSTPDAAAHDITGDIEVRALATADSWSDAGTFIVAAKWHTQGDERSWMLSRISDKLRFTHTPDGTNGAKVEADSTVATGFTDGTANWIAATLSASTGATKFYTYAGAHDPPADISDWTQLGTTVSGSATSINSGTALVTVGADDEAADEWFGLIHEVEVWDGMKADSGTLVANPRFSDVAQFAIGQTSSTTSDDVQGNTWTLVNNSTITGSWADQSTDVRDHSHGRGRFYETQEFEAGRATVTFHNNSRQYEPKFASGANYPNVVPWVPIRFRYEYGGYSEIRWSGFVEGWKVTYQQAGKTSLCVARCADAFRMFNRLLLTSYEVEVLRDNPLGYWKLQETSGTNAVDDGSAGVDGTYVNTPTLGAAGPIVTELAVGFDDSSTEEVDIGTLTGSDVGADFTVECWINLDSGDATERQPLIQLDIVDPSSPVALIVDRGGTPNERLGFIAPQAAPGWDGNAFFDQTFVADTWVHAVATVDFSEKRITGYINGTLAGSFVLDLWDQSRSTGEMEVKIAETGGGLGNFDGLISHVAIYPTLLSSGRIKAHYAARVGNFAAESFDTRIGNILAAVGWGGGNLLDTSSISLTTISDLDSTVLAALRRAAAAEGGSVYIGPDGRVIGRGRHYTSLQQHTAAFTYATNFASFEAESDNDFLYNIISATLADGTIIRAEDDTSKNSFGPSNLQIDKVDLSQADAADLVLEQLSRFKDPKFRTEKISFTPETDAANLWPEVRDRDLLDRITLAATPPGGGSALAIDLHIEHIGYRGTPSELTIDYRLSPASQDQFWILGNANLSLLGTTTILAA